MKMNEIKFDRVQLYGNRDPFNDHGTILDMSVCSECGGTVVDEGTHIKWHFDQSPKEMQLRMNGWK